MTVCVPGIYMILLYDDTNDNDDDHGTVKGIKKDNGIENGNVIKKTKVSKTITRHNDAVGREVLGES